MLSSVTPTKACSVSLHMLRFSPWRLGHNWAICVIVLSVTWMQSLRSMETNVLRSLFPRKANNPSSVSLEQLASVMRSSRSQTSRQARCLSSTSLASKDKLIRRINCVYGKVVGFAWCRMSQKFNHAEGLTMFGLYQSSSKACKLQDLQHSAVLSRSAGCVRYFRMCNISSDGILCADMRINKKKGEKQNWTAQEKKSKEPLTVPPPKAGEQAGRAINA